MIVTIDLPTERVSEDVAARLAACLGPSMIITFSGEIGAGKTTLIRAMLRSLGVTSAIKSPTFSLVETYQTNPLQIHHVDLYRIHDESELDYIGFRDLFSNNAVCCIEWPERVSCCLEHVDIGFSLSLNGEGREMHARAYSSAGVLMLSCFLGE